MQTTRTLVDAITLERKALAKSANLHWFHCVIVILSVLLTLSAWYFSKSQVDKNSEAQFERESSQVVELVVERMHKYEDALWAGAAAIEAHGEGFSFLEWNAFAESLHIGSKYPGISGIGVIENILPENLQAHVESQRRLRPDYRVHPDHAEKDILPIVYIEPQEPNVKALGLDMAHESNRYEAAKKARDSGVAQITGPIVLVQDDGQTPGFLFYAPFYDGGMHGTAEERRETFSGMVYAPFIVKKLMAGTLEKAKRRVGVQLSDNDEVLYNENRDSEADFDLNPLFKKTSELNFYGRTWSFEIWSTQSFRNDVSSSQPLLILIGGISIDALLLTLFVLLSRASRRTLTFADRVTAELRSKAKALTKSNEDLESFAYIASHDLKTPLRGIADLTAYLEEDLQPYMAAADANPDVHHNFERLRQQTGRMNNLITGILDYSSVGGRKDVLETVDVVRLLNSLQLEFGVREEQLIIARGIPHLDTYLIRFEQVMSNLVGNAFKYHHSPEQAVVTVSCAELYDFYEFSVSDNGPGIDPKFHSKIFDVFQTLQSKDDIESTGVGLSIVKKSVEALGGTIVVSSKLGEGTTFRFQWPKTIPTQQHQFDMVI